MPAKEKKEPAPRKPRVRKTSAQRKAATVKKSPAPKKPSAPRKPRVRKTSEQRKAATVKKSSSRSASQHKKSPAPKKPRARQTSVQRKATADRRKSRAAEKKVQERGRSPAKKPSVTRKVRKSRDVSTTVKSNYKVNMYQQRRQSRSHSPSNSGETTPRPKRHSVKRQLTNAEIRKIEEIGKIIGLKSKSNLKSRSYSTSGQATPRPKRISHIHLPRSKSITKTAIRDNLHTLSKKVQNIDTLFVPISVDKHHGIFEIIPMSDSGRTLPHKTIRLEIDIRERQVIVNGKKVADLNYVKSALNNFADGSSSVSSFTWNPLTMAVRAAKAGVNVVKSAGTSAVWLMKCITIVIELMSDIIYLAVGAVAIYALFKTDFLTPSIMNMWGLGRMYGMLPEPIMLAVNNSKWGIDKLHEIVFNKVANMRVPVLELFKGGVIRV